MTKKKSVVKASEPAKRSATTTIGAGGAVITDGWAVQDERNPALQGSRQYTTYSDILANTAIVSAGVRYFLNLVARARWKVREANDTAEAKEIAAFMNKQMTGMNTPWSRIVRRAAMYRFYGFSLQEWTAKLEKGVYGMADIAPRPQSTIERWWRDEKTGELVGVTQRNPQTEMELPIPRWKLIYIVDDSLDDSPMGLGLFRHIVKACARLSRYEQLEGFGFESDLRGIPVGRAPFAAMREAVDAGLMEEKDKTAAEAPLRDFITNHIKNPALGILLDSLTYQSLDEAGTPSAVKQWDIDLLKGSSTSLPDMAKAIERVNREIARILGVEGLLLGEQTTGSHALSSDKSQNVALIVDSTLQELCNTFQHDFIKTLMLLNGWDLELMPKFDTEMTRHQDITRITQALKDLAAAGAKLDFNDPATNEVRELLGLPHQPVVDPAVAILRSSGREVASTTAVQPEEV